MSDDAVRVGVVAERVCDLFLEVPGTCANSGSSRLAWSLTTARANCPAGFSRDLDGELLL